MRLVGRVGTGTGTLGHWMTVYADAYTAATGMVLYPGSLNLVLEEPWSLPRERTTIAEEDAGRLVHLVACTVSGHKCFILRTDKAEASGAEEHRRLEILAEVRLRDELELTDGDTIEVVVGAPSQSG